jgi:putative membrane protein
MRDFIWRWLILTISVFAAAQLRFLGISYDSWEALLGAALLLGVANAVVKPALMLISLPLIFLSLGVFMLFINAGLFYAVGKLVAGFHVPTFGSAFGGSIVVSLVGLLLGAHRPRRVTVEYLQRPPRRPPPGKGPIIDV